MKEQDSATRHNVGIERLLQQWVNIRNSFLSPSRCFTHLTPLIAYSFNFILIFFYIFPGESGGGGGGGKGAALVWLKKKKSRLFQHEASESTSQTATESLIAGKKRKVAKSRIHFESVEALRSGYLRT